MPRSYLQDHLDQLYVRCSGDDQVHEDFAVSHDIVLSTGVMQLAEQVAAV